MEVIPVQFQSELLNIIHSCFNRNDADSKENDFKTQKRDAKGEFLDRVTPFCVAFIEQRNFDLDNVSQFFNVQYSEIKFQDLSRDFKLMHSGEYSPEQEPTPIVYLCRTFMVVLNLLTNPPTNNEPVLQPENIKNVSIAIADLFLSINVFVLYHCAKQELINVIQNNKKNQGAQHTIITRIVDKLAPVICAKIKVEATKLACYQTPELQLRLIQAAELKKTSNEKFFTWDVLDFYFERKDFSPLTSIHNIRDAGQIYFWESQNSINFSIVIIPIVHKLTESKLENKQITSSKLKVQIGTIGSVAYIFDLLNIEERNVGLNEMTWFERINYLKQLLNVTEDIFEQYKIVQPQLIPIGLLNVKLQNGIPKYIVIKTLGFGLYKAFYSSPKSLKRPLDSPKSVKDEKETTIEEPNAADNRKKIRF